MRKKKFRHATYPTNLGGEKKYNTIYCIWYESRGLNTQNVLDHMIMWNTYQKLLFSNSALGIFYVNQCSQRLICHFSWSTVHDENWINELAHCWEGGGVLSGALRSYSPTFLFLQRIVFIEYSLDLSTVAYLLTKLRPHYYQLIYTNFRWPAL